MKAFKLQVNDAKKTLHYISSSKLGYQRSALRRNIPRNWIVKIEGKFKILRIWEEIQQCNAHIIINN